MPINIYIQDSNPPAESGPVNPVAPVAGGTAPVIAADDPSAMNPAAAGTDAGTARIADILASLPDMPDVVSRNGEAYQNAGAAPVL